MLESAIDELDLEDRVEITGWQTPDQVRDTLESSRALVLPSFAEGLPVVLMEALALQRPAISTYIAGIPELVRPGETGWLVPAGDVQSLVAAMKDLLNCSTSQLTAMGTAGRSRVSDNHDARKNAHDLYCRICDVVSDDHS